MIDNFFQKKQKITLHDEEEIIESSPVPLISSCEKPRDAYGEKNQATMLNPFSRLVLILDLT